MTEWNPSGYATISGLQQAMAAEALALLDLRGTERVLDLGCGNGKVTATIARRLTQGSVVGVDASADMIAFARAEFSSPAQSNLRFQTEDIRRMPFREEFDLVVSFNALHWIPNQEEALSAIYTAMKSGGRAQLRLVPKGERRSLEDVLEETRLSIRWARYFQDFSDPYLHLTSEQYAELAERCGLRVVHQLTQDKAWDFQSRAAFETFGSVTFVEWTKCLPAVEKPAFVLDVLDRYQGVANTTPGEDNTFKFYQMDITLAKGK